MENPLLACISGSIDFEYACGFCHKDWVSELNYCMYAACSLESIMAELNRFPESTIDSPKRSTNQN